MCTQKSVMLLAALTSGLVGTAACRADWFFAGLGTLGGEGSFANAVSADGSVVVGTAFNADGFPEAFRWEDGVMVGLSALSGANAD